MQLSEVYLGLGEKNFGDLLKTVSMSRLRTYQLFDRVKTRCHLTKLNTEMLRKASPRLWERLKGGDADLASDLAQSVLVCHMDMITAVLDLLDVPHQDGFFDSNADLSSHLTEGWQQRVYSEFKDKFPQPVLLFYVNHLGWEVAKSETVFLPQ